jgi:hypothetical protein
MPAINYLRRRLSAAALLALALAGLAGCGGVSVHTGGDYGAPRVIIDGLYEGEELYGDRHVTITATDPDSNIDRLRVWLDGELVFSDTYYTYRAVEDFVVYGDPSQAGWHTLDAEATDYSGNYGRDSVDYYVVP